MSFDKAAADFRAAVEKPLLEKLKESEASIKDREQENAWLRDVGIKREAIVFEMETETRKDYTLEDASMSLDQIKKLIKKYYAEKGDFQKVPLRPERAIEKLKEELEQAKRAP